MPQPLAFQLKNNSFIFPQHSHLFIRKTNKPPISTVFSTSHLEKQCSPGALFKTYPSVQSCQPASGITEADELGSDGPNQQEPPACKEPWFAHGTPLPPSHTHPNRYTNKCKHLTWEGGWGRRNIFRM